MRAKIKKFDLRPSNETKLIDITLMILMKVILIAIYFKKSVYF